jgi:hypothetical protein
MEGKIAWSSWRAKSVNLGFPSTGGKKGREKERERERERERNQGKPKNVSLNNQQNKLTSTQAGYTKSFSLL